MKLRKLQTNDTPLISDSMKQNQIFDRSGSSVSSLVHFPSKIKTQLLWSAVHADTTVDTPITCHWLHYVCQSDAYFGMNTFEFL